MNKAVVISGKANDAELYIENFRQNILEPNPNADIFISTWSDSDVNKIIQLYSPRQIHIEPCDDFIINNIKQMVNNLDIIYYDHDLAKDKKYINPFLMWYKWIQVGRLFNKDHYDFVIKTRFDVELEKPILPNGKNNIPGGADHRGGINDVIAWGSGEFISQYLNLFTALKECYQISEYVHPERFLRAYLINLLGLNINRTKHICKVGGVIYNNPLSEGFDLNNLPKVDPSVNSNNYEGWS